MRRGKLLVLFFVLAIVMTNIVSSICVAAEPPTAENGKAFLHALSDAFVDATEKVKPAVVSVISIQKVRVAMPQFGSPDMMAPFKDFWGDDFLDRFFQRRFPEQKPQEYQRRGVGSGMIVDAENGYVLTVNHVVEGADEIKVILSDKRSFTATVKGQDPQTDVAVLQIDGEDLPEVDLGNSDEIRVGDWVVAIGNPFELNYTVTAGIISAKGRSIGITSSSPEQRGYEDFIQTDAAINPGNSGGPLINLEGKVIGINDAIATRSGGYQGIGFAIPINMAKLVMDQLITHGKVTRGWLGVMIQNVTPDLAEKFNAQKAAGALVSQVFPDSPAEKAGLQAGDIIIEVNERETPNVDALRNLIAFMQPDTKAEITFLREGKEKTTEIEIGEQPADLTTAVVEEKTEKTYFGISAAEATTAMKEKYDIANDAEGVVVVGVEAGSPAATAGIKEGNLIAQINRKKVSSLDDFKRYMKDAEKEGTALLLIQETRGSRFVILSKE